MKKIIVFIMLMFIALIIFIAVSCRSPQPAAAPAPEPAPISQPQPQIVEAARHYSNIILEGAVRYEVQSGDILSGIAKHFYQDGSYYPLIMMVSDEVKDPDMIEPGMVLTVPDLYRNILDGRAKNSMNGFFAKIADIEEQRNRHETALLIRSHTTYFF